MIRILLILIPLGIYSCSDSEPEMKTLDRTLEILLETNRRTFEGMKVRVAENGMRDDNVRILQVIDKMWNLKSDLGLPKGIKKF